MASQLVTRHFGNAPARELEPLYLAALWTVKFILLR